MKIACLSGKGGAGKTFVAVNLVYVASLRGRGEVVYIDCDVEEPNGRLFFRPEGVREEAVCSLLPAFDGEACTGCKECVRFCRFHALLYIADKPMVFAEMCHSCGGCRMVCPAHAVTEIEKPVGKLEVGAADGVSVVTGVLDTGEASGIPVIRDALGHAGGLTVIDCPPGSACSVTESVADADYCILVAEPTAFGFHNFKMVHELVSLMGKKCGVVVNKQDGPFPPLDAYCEEAGVEVLARIPYDAGVAASVADGRGAAKEDERVRAGFEDVLGKVEAAL